jgi:putative flippase GtrA
VLEDEMTRFAKFAGVGVVGWLVQVVTLSALIAAGAHYLLATALAVEVTILHNFAWHLRCTWREAAAPSRSIVVQRLVRFNTSTALVSIVGNVVITALAVEHLHVAAPLANTLAALLLAVLNFALANRWVFQTAELRTLRCRVTVAPAVSDSRWPSRASEVHGALARCFDSGSRFPRALRVLAARLPRALA